MLLAEKPEPAYHTDMRKRRAPGQEMREPPARTQSRRLLPYNIEEN